MQVVGEVGNLNEALSLIAAGRPDIILLKHDPESGFGLTFFQRSTRPVTGRA